jgi:hypothetical protein
MAVNRTRLPLNVTVPKAIRADLEREAEARNMSLSRIVEERLAPTVADKKIEASKN